MQKKERLSLQTSEAHVFRAAATIYAAHITAGSVQQGTEQQWLEKSLSEALHLALRADQRISSDEEVSGGLGGGGGSGLRGRSGPLGLKGE
jgi:hypothetical protein